MRKSFKVTPCDTTTPTTLVTLGGAEGEGKKSMTSFETRKKSSQVLKKLMTWTFSLKINCSLYIISYASYKSSPQICKAL